jgi:hypothetical protein
MLHDWFPDAPLWVPVTAMILDGLVLLIIAACLVGSPLDAWRRRHDRTQADLQYVDLKRFQGIQADLLTAPAKQGVTAELKRVSKHGKDG